MPKARYHAAKYLLYFLGGVVLCVLQNTPGLFTIAGTKPMLVAALAVAAAMFEGEFAGALCGAAGGLLCDIFSYYRFGYYAFLFLLCCCAVGLLTRNYMRPVVTNCVLFTFLAMLLSQGVAFFFTVLIRGYEAPGLLFAAQVLPLCLYTALSAVPVFYGVRWFHGRLRQLLEARS